MYPHLPVNYTLRPPGNADIEAIIDLIYAQDLAEVGIANRSDQDGIRKDWEDLDLAQDAWCILAPEGKLAAYGTLWSYEATNFGRLYGDGYVHPDYKGRGLGATLLGLMEIRAADFTAIHQEGTRLVLVNNIIASSASARELFEAYNYTLVRVFFTMHIDLNEVPEHPVWPEGFTIHVCSGSEKEIHQAYETIEEGFKDHFAHTPRSFEEWQSHMVRENFDPSLWFLVMAGDEVAGAILCKISDPETGNGWVEQLAVRRPWRRHGLGSALLHHAFYTFSQRGIKRVGLGVDGASLTGAQRLYERAGMHITMRIGRYEKELRGGKELHPGRVE